jgi:DNA adenine methylase
MKYMGSKARHAKEIIKAMETELGGTLWNWGGGDKDYIEPFVGGANMIDKIPNVFRTKKGNDINVHLIEMFKAVQGGWLPPDTVSEQEYKQLMSKSDIYCTGIESALIGFVGIGCSYSGKWFGGYARGNANNGSPRNYCLESKKNLLNQDIKNVVFSHGNYYDMVLLDQSLIYCDPPYAETTKYKDYFDHNRFWDWCNKMVEDGHKVFVSEYNAPEGWRCIWQKEVNNSLTKETGSKQGVEKLFTK